MNSQIVRVKALNNVVSIMTLEEKDPSCPMFFAMIYQVTVVGEASMIIMATSSLPRKPIWIANGKIAAGMATSFKKAAANVGPIFWRASRPLKVAPSTSSASGVAVDAM